MNTITLEPIARGEAKQYTFQVKNADGTAMNLTGKKIVATLRLADVETITKRNALAGGGDEQLAGTALGVATLKFAPADTAALAPGKLEGDLWVYTGNSDPVRVAKFRLPIEQAQTRTFP